MSEAQIVSGADLLDRPISQVITSLREPLRAGSLLVTSADSVGEPDLSALKSLSALVVVKPYSEQTAASDGGGSQKTVSPVPQADVNLLRKICSEANLPLVLVHGLGETNQAAEDIRLSLVDAARRQATAMYAHLLSLTLEGGLSALAEEVSSLINRPLAIETIDFKVLAAKNLGATPANQQRGLSDQAAQALKLKRQAEKDTTKFAQPLEPLRVGRRLVVPIVLASDIVGYVSAAVKPNDDLEIIGQSLMAAALAAMVVFNFRQWDASASSLTYRTLLTDTLSGRNLSSTDLERMERHFGFDLCDALLVFATQVIEGVGEPKKQLPVWPESPFVSTEVEGAQIFVIPVTKKANRTWQQEAESLLMFLKKTYGEAAVQLGASRLVESTSELEEAYQAARQTLIIGSMILGDEPFVMGYGDLGVKRLVYMMIDHPELERFYEENLGLLEAYDAEWESELVPTLRLYLKHGANLNSAARELFIHRHTLTYRLEQIAEILNVDIDSQEVLLNLQIAFLIKDMKGKAKS
jgi:sugar diacid utilization regulator